MKYTIKDLAEGKCTVKNDGTLDELNKVLKLAFPADPSAPYGAYVYYSIGSSNRDIFIGSDSIDLPTQSVKDFLNTDEQIVFNTQQHYNNTNGSLYKIAEQRGWNSYTFDVIKRLDRGGKKDPIRQEIEKSIDVLKLWLLELED